MINKNDHPVAWALLLDELDDAREHLGMLLKEMVEDPDYAEANLRVDLWHIFAHLNRAWFSRNHLDGIQMVEWDKASAFPTDLEPT